MMYKLWIIDENCKVVDEILLDECQVSYPLTGIKDTPGIILVNGYKIIKGDKE